MQAGLKRAFHARHVEGLLSGHGLRILDSCCDAAMDMADQQTLDLWQRVEQEVRGWSNVGTWLSSCVMMAVQQDQLVVGLRCMATHWQIIVGAI
jgi:hypothetical protein